MCTMNKVVTPAKIVAEAIVIVNNNLGAASRDSRTCVQPTALKGRCGSCEKTWPCWELAKSEEEKTRGMGDVQTVGSTDEKDGGGPSVGQNFVSYKTEHVITKEVFMVLLPKLD